MTTRSATLALSALVAVLALAWTASATDPCPPCEWVGETAWSAGCRYVERGNWATYTGFWCECREVPLYAGQTLLAGTVKFEPCECNGEVKITITLNSGWRFADVCENVKIQDYATAPSGNPAPGLFEYKFCAETSPFSVCVPKNCFYGVHVDVERCVVSNFD